MVEHSAVNRVVVGSSPTRGVIRMDIGQQDNCSNSFLYFFIRLHGQAVKTPPFHGGIRGSNPLGVIEQNIKGNSNCRLGSMAEQLICNQQVVGSTPTVGSLDLQLSWLEQPAHNRSVLGSSPRRSISFLFCLLWPGGSAGQSAALSRRRSWVRTPSGSLTIIYCKAFDAIWDLSSAGRASALQAEGHRFEPCRSHPLLILC